MTFNYSPDPPIPHGGAQSSDALNTAFHQIRDEVKAHESATSGAHASSAISDAVLTEVTAIDNSPRTAHDRFDMLFKTVRGVINPAASSLTTAVAGFGSDLTAMLALLKSHDHSDNTKGGKLTQANTHQSVDTDTATTAIHHTIGPGATQAAAGNHAHTGLYVPMVSVGVANGVATLDGSGTLVPTQVPTAIARGHVIDGKPTAQTVPNKTVQLAGSYTFWNSANVQKTVSGNSPAIDAVNALPTGSNLRTDLLYIDDAGAMQWKAGVPALSSPQDPTRDTGTWPLAYVGPISSTTTAITAGMIRDARSSPTAGMGNGTGGGGGGVDLSAKPFLTYHSDGTLTQELDLFAWANGSVDTAPDATDLSGKYVAPSRIRTGSGASDGTFAHILNEYIMRDTASRLTATNNVVTLAVPDPLKPWAIIVNGKLRYATAPLTATASGSTGVRYLVVDVSTGLTLSLVASVPNNANMLVLAQYQYVSGSPGNLLTTNSFQDFGPMANMAATQVALKSLVATDSGAGAVGQIPPLFPSWSNWPTMGTVAFDVPCLCLAVVTLRLCYSTTIAAGSSIFWEVALDGVPLADTQMTSSLTESSKNVYITAVIPNIAPSNGAGHTFAVQWTSTDTTTNRGTVLGGQQKMNVMLFRQGS